MKVKQILSFASIKNLRALMIVAALAQLSFGQAIPRSMTAASSGLSVSISPSEVVIPPGGTADYTITVGPTTSTAAVTFAISGLPADSMASIAPEGGGVYSLTIVTTRQIRQGEYTFTVTATSGDMSGSASAKLIVLL